MSSIEQQARARFENEKKFKRDKEKWIMQYEADVQFAETMIKLIKTEVLG